MSLRKFFKQHKVKALFVFCMFFSDVNSTMTLKKKEILPFFQKTFTSLNSCLGNKENLKTTNYTPGALCNYAFFEKPEQIIELEFLLQESVCN